jgi:protein O-mannosyl-transferase
MATKKTTKQKNITKEKPVTDQKVSKKIKITLAAIVALFAIILYAQSVSFNYTLDDATVTVGNRFINQGFAGIPTILKTDYWSGYNEFIRGPVYRPVPLIVAAIEWQLSPDSPHFYHAVNILLYALSCMLLFLFLCRLFKKQNLLLPFICSILYVAHPIHTEVVDSIKSCDEILCFLFAILSMTLFIKWIEKNSILNLILGVLCYFLTILSKETGITFLVIIPLALFAFTNATIKKALTATLLIVVVSGVFFLIRAKVFEGLVNHNFDSPLNNSLFAAPDNVGRIATAFYILLKYIQLLIFPHPLSSDYSYNQIKIQTMSDAPALLGILIYVALGIYAVWQIRKKSILAFAILFYLIVLSPVSNLIIHIGSTMAERFLFIPSFGFCLAIAFLLLKITKSETVKSKFTNISQFFSMNKTVFLFVIIIAGLYSFKTYTRSQDWKGNVELFEHDVTVADSSARAHYNWGTCIMANLYPKETNPSIKSNYLNKAINEFQTAVRIFPIFPDAYRSLAGVLEDVKDYENELKTYEILVQIDRRPDSTIFDNLGILYSRYKKWDKALNYLDSATLYYPDYAKAYNNKAFVYLNLQKSQEAIDASEKALKINPNYPKPYCYIGCGYMNMGNYKKAIEYLNKSLILDPNDEETKRFLGTAYKANGEPDKAKMYLGETK